MGVNLGVSFPSIDVVRVFGVNTSGFWVEEPIPLISFGVDPSS